MHGDGLPHRLPAHLKLASTFLFVIVVVGTPREALWAFVVFASLLIALALWARVPGRTIVRRLAIEVPLVAGALALPFVAGGERFEFLFLSLSREGAWVAWNVIAKATLGIAAATLLLSTTQPSDLIRGLARLRVPQILVAIAGFTVRYMDVVGGEMRRMRIARLSRAANPSWLWQLRAQASTAGTLFIRSYERGERILHAMWSRGYTGEMPALDGRSASRTEWAVAMSLPVAAGLVGLAARLTV